MVRTSPNGLFSFKMFPVNYKDVLALNEGFLAHICPSWVVFLRREDRVAQAVSYSRAIRSGAWFAGTKAKKPVKYDKEHIAECERSILLQEDFWKRVFELTKAEVLTVTYEDLQNEPAKILGRIKRYVGLREEDRNELKVARPTLQRGSSSLKWVTRYQNDTVMGRV